MKGEAQSKPSRAEAVLKAFHEEEAMGKAYDTRLMARLWPFVRPHSRLLLLALLGIVVTTAASLARPLIMLEAIDRGVMTKDADVLMKAGLALAGVLLIEQVISYAQIYIIQVVGARAMASLRRSVFEFIHRLRLAYFDTQPVGRLVTRVTNDVDAILELFASGALNAFGDLLKLLGIVILMLVLDWKLSLIAFAVTPVVAVMVVWVRRRMREVFREIRVKTARMNATMNEQVSGMGVIQAYRREEGAAQEFDEINRAYRDATLRSIKYEAMQDAAIEMVAAICLASVVVSLGYRPVSFGTVVAFYAYLVQFFEPISALAQRYTLLQSAMAGAERVFGLLDQDSSELDAQKRRQGSHGKSGTAVELDNVDFGYKSHVPVLRGVSMKAVPGEKVALVGPTGSGKTTITGLILRLYEIDGGVIRVLGRDIQTLSRHELRRQFAVVPQDVYLFPGSVLTNIYAGETPDRERAEAVLDQLGVLSWFSEREGGLDAEVVERGSNFSAGERQLVAFARALYRDAAIVILDEATANVDSATEFRIQRAMDELLRERTAIIIAHRLSTIRKADRIVVLRAGQVEEQGSHEELLAKGGLYARLHELQFARPRAESGSISVEEARA